MIPHHSLLALLFFLSFLAFSQGQEQTVKTEILTLSFGKSLPECYILNGNKTEKISIIPQRLSVPLKYSGSSKLHFFASEEEAKASRLANSTSEPLATFDIPSSGDQTLLVLDFSNKEVKTEGEEEVPVPVAKAFPISNKDFKVGDYLVFNFSEKDVHLYLGELELELAGGENGTISDATLRKESSDLTVRLQTEVMEEARDVYSSIWGHRNIQRNFLFILDRDDKFRPLNLRKYSDVPS
ncbi:MAG: hypothetical protein ACSHYB_06125 [Roseibacillus sp.]